jgi:hypothetical protein
MSSLTALVACGACTLACEPRRGASGGSLTSLWSPLRCKLSWALTSSSMRRCTLGWNIARTNATAPLTLGDHLPLHSPAKHAYVQKLGPCQAASRTTERSEPPVRTAVVHCNTTKPSTKNNFVCSYLIYGCFVEFLLY